MKHTKRVDLKLFTLAFAPGTICESSEERRLPRHSATFCIDLRCQCELVNSSLQWIERKVTECAEAANLTIKENSNSGSRPTCRRQHRLLDTRPGPSCPTEVPESRTRWLRKLLLGQECVPPPSSLPSASLYTKGQTVRGIPDQKNSWGDHLDSLVCMASTIRYAGLGWAFT